MKQTFEEQFREMEGSFRPRNEFKHEEVVENLAYVVKQADVKVERLERIERSLQRQLNKTEDSLELRTAVLMGFFVFNLLGLGYLCYS